MGLRRSLWAAWLASAMSEALVVPPSAPLNVRLSTVSQDALQVEWEPPASDGGAPVSAYLVEWDPNPGVREVQVITSSANTGANEVQTIRTYAGDVDEVQEITTSAASRPEVQTITTSAAPGETLGGFFTIELDTTAQGGSKQRSGIIAYNAPATTGRASVQQILNAMSNIGPNGVQSVVRTGPDAQGGYVWTIMFAASMGNVPPLTLSSSFLTASGANVVLNTQTEGNVISSGTFTLGFRGATTADIPFDASDAVMQSTLEQLDTIESVTVRRTGPDFQQGYKWRVTFTSNSPLNTGDVPQLTVGSNTKLVAYQASVTVAEIVQGNQLGGTFQLKFKTLTSNPLPVDCSAATMKTELEALGTGTLDVSRTTLPDPQGGYTWTVSFLSLKGSLPAFQVPTLNALTETRTDAVVSKGVTVTRSRPGTDQEIQDIKVTTTNPTVSTATFFSLRVGFSGQTTTTGPIPANAMGDGTCMSTKPEVQQIAVTTVDTTAQGGDSLVSSNAAIQLVFTSNTLAATIEKTKPIKINSAAGDCTVGAAVIKNELEALEGIVGSVVVSSSAIVASQQCTWTVTFSSERGNLVQMKVMAADSGTTPSNTVSIGDDTITITTLQDGSIDIIKAELEKLPNVATVSVSATTPSTDQTCTWSVTFDGNAGDLPLMEVSVDNGATFGASGATVGGDAVTIVDNRQGSSSPLGGVFALEFDGQRTGYMPFDVTANALQNQLEVLSTIGSVAVSRSNADPNGGYQWTVSFLNDLGDLPALVPDAATLTGTAPFITIREKTMGVLPPFNSKDAANGTPAYFLCAIGRL